MIRNILFDLDDTLLDFHRSEHTALAKMLTHFGIEPTQSVLDRYSVINLSQWKLLEKGIITRNEVKVGRYRLLFEELGVDLSPEKATEYYESRLAEGHFFIDGAKQLLDSLYGKYRMYLVSNGTASVQKGRLKSSDIGRYFDGIFISEEVGADKPNREFFDLCFASIPDFGRSQTVIVGDSLTSDILGGKNAGITTVWFDKDDRNDASDILPDYRITKLSSLPGLLEGL